MTPGILRLQSYPFEKLSALKSGIQAPEDKSPIIMSIGEPSHPTPELIRQALIENLSGLGTYPSTKGIPELRSSIRAWLSKRFQFPAEIIDPDSQILPVSGTREALFSFCQCLIDSQKHPVVVMPNPFYQIYEGAALLAGAEPYFLNTPEETGYLPDFDSVPEQIWNKCQLVYICSPGNPCGTVLSRTRLEQLLNLADRYGFVIASDECYSELYEDENNPPIGLLQAAFSMGNMRFKNCVVVHSLSKRSNAPGLRSGFIAGDAEILKSYFKYRTYHGCVMPIPTQYASAVAWQEEKHVISNRILYREKFSAFAAILNDVSDIKIPPAGFYVWLKTPVSDTDFARELFAEENVTVLPGSYLSRHFAGIDPGLNHVRIALVAPLAECLDAAQRIKKVFRKLI